MLHGCVIIQSSQKEHILESEEFEPAGPPEDRDICIHARRNAKSQSKRMMTDLRSLWYSLSFRDVVTHSLKYRLSCQLHHKMVSDACQAIKE